MLILWKLWLWRGGPTAEADLAKTQLVIKDGYYAQTVQFDIKKYSETGHPMRYMMQKEDLLIVPVHRPGFFQTNVGTIISALGVVTTTILLIDQLGSSSGTGN